MHPLRPLRSPTAASLAALALLGCTSEQVSGSANLAEPVRVESGQFIAGTLPGIAPVDGGSAGAGGATPGPGSIPR